MKNIFLIASVSTLVLFSSLAQAGMYRWVDEKGKVHFSDKVPVAASRKPISEMDKNGIVKKTVDREAEVQAKLDLEANKEVIKQEKEVARLAAEKIAELKKRDDYLLSTYENKQELIASFENKIKLMKGNAAILEAQNVVLLKRLEGFKNSAASAESKSKKQTMSKKVVSISKTIEQYQQALEQNKQERVLLSNNYQEDIKRYLELTK